MKSKCNTLCFLLSIACALCVDPYKCGQGWKNLGRVNYFNMCDEQRMEKLIERLDDISMFMNNVEDGEFKDVFYWPGVTCSEDGVNVLKIE